MTGFFPIDYLLGVLFSLPAILLNSSATTAAGNAVWGGVGLATALGLHWILHYGRDDLPAFVRESFEWGRVPGICVALHRTYWNVGIWYRPDGASYHPLILEYKFCLFVLIAGIVVGTVKATTPYLPTHQRKTFTGGLGLYLFASGMTAGYLAL